MAGLGGWLWLRSDAGQVWLGAQIEGALTGSMTEGDAHIGRFSSDLWHIARVDDLRLNDADGRAVIAVDSAEVHLSLRSLLRWTVRAPLVVVEGVRVDLQQDDDGVYDIARMFAATEPAEPTGPWEGLPIGIEVPAISVRAPRVAVQTGEDEVVLEGLGLRAALHGRGRRIALTDLSVSAALVSPDHGSFDVGGGAVWNDDGLEDLDLTLGGLGSGARVWGRAPGLLGDDGEVDLRVDVETLSLRRIDALVGAGLAGQVGGELRVIGPLDDVHVGGQLVGQGSTELDVSVDARGDAFAQTFSGKLTASALRLDHLLPAVGDPLSIAGALKIEGEADDSALGVSAEGTWEGGPIEVVGLTFDRVDAGLALDQGILLLSDLDVRGDVGRISGGGTLDPSSGVLDLSLDLSRVDPAPLRALSVPAELDGSRARGKIRVRVGLNDDGLPVQVDGDLTVAPLRWGPEVRVSRVVGTLDLDFRGEELTVKADADFRGVEAYGAQVAGGRMEGLRLVNDLQSLSITANVRADDVAMELVPEALRADLGRGVSIGTAAGPFAVAMDHARPEEVEVDLQLDFEAHRLLRFDGSDGSLVVDLDGDDLVLIALMKAGSRPLLDTRIAMGLTELDVEIVRLITEPMPSQRWVARPRSHLRLTPSGGVEDVDIELRSKRGVLHAEGQAGGDGEQDLRAEVTDLDLAVVAELLPTLAGGLRGALGGTVRLHGQPSALELDGSVDAEGIAWWEEDEDGAPLPVARDLAGRLTFAARDDTLSVDGTIAALGEPLLDLTVALPVHLDLEDLGPLPESPVRADVRLVAGQISRLEAVMPGVVLPVGVASGRLRAKGTLVRPTFSLASVAELPLEGLDAPLRVETFVDYSDRDTVASVNLLEGLVRRSELRASGRTRLDEVLDWALVEGEEPDFEDLDLWLSSLTGGLSLHGLPLDRLATLAGSSVEVEGSLWGDVALAGSLSQPRPSAQLRVEEGRLGGVDLTHAVLDLLSDDQGYTLGLDVAMRDRSTDRSGEVYIDGRIPVVVDLTEPDVQAWSKGDLDLRATAELPLSVLAAFDAGFRQLEGHVDIYGTILGDPFDPEPSASISLSRDAVLGYEPLGVRAEDLALYARFDRDGVVLDELRARTGVLDPRSAQLGFIGTIGKRLTTGLSRTARSVVTSEDSGRGAIEASGTARLDQWSLTELDITSRLDRAVVLGNRDQLLRLTTRDGRPLKVTNTAAFPKIRGAVRVDEADFFLDYATAVGGGSVDVDPRIKINREGRVVTSDPPESSVLDELDVEVAINLGRASRARLSMPLESMGFLGQTATALTRIDLSARVGGDVVFRQRPCHRPGPDGEREKIPGREGACGLFHPRMEGGIDILEGQARVFRADFDLRDSAVRYYGGDVSDPHLDINGEMKTGDVTIDMAITGTALDPEIDFTSAQSDQIFATLLLGTSPDSLGSQGASQLAFAAAMTAFQSVLSGANLGTFSIEPSGQITWGLAVARDLYVEGTLGGTPRPDQNTIEVEVEYTIQQDVIGRVGFGAYAIPFWLDLLFERRFD